MQPGTHVNACTLHYLFRSSKLVFHSLTLTQPSENISNARCSVSSVIQTASLSKQTTFSDATSGFPAKQRLRNERRNSILMTRHFPDLDSASDWLKQISHAAEWSCREGHFLQPIRSASQICVYSDTSSVWNFCARFSDVISGGN